MTKDLEDILRRLGELLPGAAPKAEWHAGVAFRWRASGRRGSQGWLQPVRHVHRIKLADLRGIDAQIAKVEQNTRQFLDGRPANNVLLTGARGTGKSSIVKGLLNKYSKQSLRLIEVEKNDLVDLPQIVDQVAGRKERFLLFCDDLSFHGAEDGYIALKVALDGSISTTSENMLIYATSNRRHLMPEYLLSRPLTIDDLPVPRAPVRSTLLAGLPSRNCFVFCSTLAICSSMPRRSASLILCTWRTGCSQPAAPRRPALRQRKATLAFQSVVGGGGGSSCSSRCRIFSSSLLTSCTRR